MDDTSEKSTGQEIGNYRILEEIDSGHFGTVYKGEHIVLSGRIVALKVLHSRYGSAEEQASFLREARFLEQLQHPHILTIIDAGFHEKRPYLVSTYAPGGSLRKRLKLNNGQPLALDEALTILLQVGEGLLYAHQRNIVHRDLKPDNILFNAKGEALLADFGIAKMVSTSGTSLQHITQAAGTPYYMAPEQFKGKVSRRSDQYSLACVAYELFTGRPPFNGSAVYELAYKHMSELPVPPAQINARVPAALGPILLRALEKEHEKRYPDVIAFLYALSEAIKPKSREMWLEEALLALENTQYTRSLEAFEYVLRFGEPPAVAYAGKALALYRLGQYREAHEANEHALRLAPRRALFHYAGGLILEGLQRQEEALQAYQNAARLDPAYGEAREKQEKLLRKIQNQ